MSDEAELTDAWRAALVSRMKEIDGAITPDEKEGVNEYRLAYTQLWDVVMDALDSLKTEEQP